MSQWSSFFAQQGAGVSKELGDLLGPGLFALLMALGRTGYGLAGDRLPLRACLVVFGAGAVMILGLTVRSLASGPQEVDVAQCLSLSSRGSRSGQKAQLVTGAGERLDVDVSGSIGSDVDDRFRRLCTTHEPFTIHWYSPKGPVLKIREG